MSPRKTILRELARVEREVGAGTLTRPASIPGFDQRPSHYQKAVNKLLVDRLIEGRPDDEGRMALSLNHHRLPEVRRELRPVWANPRLWLTAAALVLVAFGWVAV